MKGLIPFGAWLGLDCQATNIFTLGSNKLYCIIYNCESSLVHNMSTLSNVHLCRTNINLQLKLAILRAKFLFK